MSSESGPDLTPEQLAEKARKKELHRKSMIWTGAMTIASALAAAWVGFAPGWLLPSIGKTGARARPEEGALSPMRAAWRPFSAQALGDARKLDRLVLLSAAADWSRPSRRMDGQAYADEEVARLLARDFVAARFDPDERPDLALRYLAGYPTAALLLPTGQILDAGTFMSAPVLLRWAGTLRDKYRQRREGVLEAAGRALQTQAPTSEPPSAAAALEKARVELEKDWGPFPRFDRLAALSRLSAPWAADILARRQAAAADFEDPAGGYRRQRDAFGGFEAERRLGDQADALAFLAAADPAGAARLRAYAGALARPDGGYRAGHGFDGALDGRVFGDESGRMAASILSDAASSASEKAAASRTVERLWAARRGGLAFRRLGGDISGLLGDQLGLLEGLLAAGKLDRAAELATATARALLDEQGEALYDRPARVELSGPLDRIRVGALEARAWRDWRRLARALGPGTRRGREAAALASRLEGWLWTHAGGLDAADLAELAQARMLNGGGR